MGRKESRLADRAVKAAKPGKYCDGRGLWLCVSDSGSRKWILRVTVDRRVREMGLGNAVDVWLADARVKAAAARRLAAAGVDPIAARREARKAVPATKTFGECADALIESKRHGWRSEKHARQWETTLQTYAASLYGMPVDAIDTPGRIRLFNAAVAARAGDRRKAKARIEAVLDYAKAHKWRSGENPASWKGNLSHVLPSADCARRKQLPRGRSNLRY